MIGGVVSIIDDKEKQSIKKEEITMLNWLRERKKDNKGFTLIELIIVVAILAILIGLLAPQYIKYVEKSRRSTDASNLERLVEAVRIAAADTDYNIPADTYTISISTTGTTVTGNAKIKDAIKEYAGVTFNGNIIKSIKLKSNRWSNSSSANQISATVVVGNDAKVTVTYDPTNLVENVN